ncbi:MAG: creatininase family protein [Anaerolineales bacterium]|nr:creatininase family protein [Anaerolineales bacterium]
MNDVQKPLVLADLSWPEVAAIKDQVEMVLIPVGSNEQHGPNLSLSMDITGATEFCKKASAMSYPRLLVAPSMPWGVSHHHMNFPGTITLSSATFIQILVEVVASLQQHGFERFMFINGHGGNQAALGEAIVLIQEELEPLFVGTGLYFYFADSDIDEKFGITGITGHACEMETSAAMYLAPHIVKTDALAAGEITELAYGFRKQMAKYRVNVPFRFDRYTTNGALGDARKSSLEYGKALMDSALNNFVAFMDEAIEQTPAE